MSKVYRIGVMEGDGIGPEIVKESVKILKAVERKVKGVEFAFQSLPVGLKSYEENGSTLPEETKTELLKCDGGILGPVTTHTYDVHRDNMVNPSGRLRKELDLYANVRPAKNFVGVNTKFNNVDMVIVRENTEGMYSDRSLYQGPGEIMTDPDTVLSFRVVRRHANERIAKIGFDLASHRKKAVSLIHKKNVLRKGCGLFLESSIKIGEDYKDVEVNDFHIDAFSMLMVQEPEKFDVVVTTNMFGDILSDLAAGLVGGLGLAPGLNLGDNFILAQATHGSAPIIAGKNIANPVAEILSAKMLLEWLGIRNNDEKIEKAAQLINKAVEVTIAKGLKTVDLGGDLSTSGFGDAVCQQIETEED